MSKCKKNPIRTALRQLNKGEIIERHSPFDPETKRRSLYLRIVPEKVVEWLKKLHEARPKKGRGFTQVKVKKTTAGEGANETFTTATTHGNIPSNLPSSKNAHVAVRPFGSLKKEEKIPARLAGDYGFEGEPESKPAQIADLTQSPVSQIDLKTGQVERTVSPESGNVTTSAMPVAALPESNGAAVPVEVTASLREDEADVVDLLNTRVLTEGERVTYEDLKAVRRLVNLRDPALRLSLDKLRVFLKYRDEVSSEVPWQLLPNKAGFFKQWINIAGYLNDRTFRSGFRKAQVNSEIVRDMLAAFSSCVRKVGKGLAAMVPFSDEERAYYELVCYTVDAGYYEACGAMPQFIHRFKERTAKLRALLAECPEYLYALKAKLPFTLTTGWPKEQFYQLMASVDEKVRHWSAVVREGVRRGCDLELV